MFLSFVLSCPVSFLSEQSVIVVVSVVVVFVGMLKSIEFADLVRLFSSLRQSDRVYLG